MSEGLSFTLAESHCGRPHPPLGVEHTEKKVSAVGVKFHPVMSHSTKLTSPMDLHIRFRVSSLGQTGQYESAHFPRLAFLVPRSFVTSLVNRKLTEERPGKFSTHHFRFSGASPEHTNQSGSADYHLTTSIHPFQKAVFRTAWNTHESSTPRRNADASHLAPSNTSFLNAAAPAPSLHSGTLRPSHNDQGKRDTTLASAAKQGASGSHVARVPPRLLDRAPPPTPRVAAVLRLTAPAAMGRDHARPAAGHSRGPQRPRARAVALGDATQDAGAGEGDEGEHGLGRAEQFHAQEERGGAGVQGPGVEPSCGHHVVPHNT
ncbi:hypothetical protein Pelo_1438 [Pelomyxa schiedti]|nr:hypothetical protein Pelo_1438 [Pelomyxa schiedti]